MAMGSSVRISVIIPVFNAERTLRSCVESILRQEKNCLEIILVDDGSADASSTLCDSMSRENPEQIQVIHQSNAGSFAARIAGTAVAKGDYLLYVDADDVLLQGALMRIQEDVASGADLYLYDYIMDSVGGSTANTVRLMDIPQKTEFLGESKSQVSHAFMKGMMNTVCATAIRRAFLGEIQLYCPEQKICYGEDRLQKLQMLAAAERIVYIPHAIYHYKWYPCTQGGDLRTGSFSAEIYEDFKQVWSIERAYYTALGFDKEQSCIYDGEKLARICGLLENAWCKKKLTSDETSALIYQLSNDVLFQQLSSDEILTVVRPHIRRSASLIRGNHVQSLKLYWKLCCFLRSLRYGISMHVMGKTNIRGRLL